MFVDNYVVSTHWVINTQWWTEIFQKKKEDQTSLEVLLLNQPVHYYLQTFQLKTILTTWWCEKFRDKILKLGIRELVGIMVMGSKHGSNDKCLQRYIQFGSYMLQYRVLYSTGTADFQYSVSRDLKLLQIYFLIISWHMFVHNLPSAAPSLWRVIFLHVQIMYIS